MNVELLWISSSIIFLTWATYFDLKDRLIPDKIWLFQIITGIGILTYWDLFNQPFEIKLIIFINIVFTLIFAIGAFIVGSFGGGDSKAIFALTITAPLPFSRTLIQNDVLSTLPAIVFIMGNMLIFYLLFMLYILSANFSFYRKHATLFDRPQPNFGAKLNILISGYKVTIDQLRENRFLIPAETFDGVHWKLESLLLPGVKDDDEWDEYELERRENALEWMTKGNKEYIWVRPQPPGLLFIFLAFIMWFTLGSPLALILPF